MFIFGRVQIANMEINMVIQRQPVAQAELNAARARENSAFAKVMAADVRKRSEPDVAVAAAQELLVQAEEDLRYARGV